MNSIEKNNNYDMMDIFRLFFALCVVGLHVPLFDKNSSLNSVVSVVIFDMAVPFFFIVSSFLFFTKCQEASKPSLYLKKYEKRLLKLYVSWSLIYLPFSLWTSFNHSFDSISLKYLLAELINYFKLFLFESAYVHLYNYYFFCFFHTDLSSF